MKKIVNKSTASHILSIIKNNGILYLIKLLFIQLECLFLKIFIRNKFEYASIKLNYFYNSYNRTWLNERCIEIAIGKFYTKKFINQDILEIGNVMSHYHTVGYDVIDKYEVSKNVINHDVVDYNSDKKYKLILSLSTLEHVGWDEEIKDEHKILKSILNLKNMLSKNGELIITLPIGYNPLLDEKIKNGVIKFDCEIFYIKTGRTEWMLTDKDTAYLCEYNFFKNTALAIMVGIFYN